MHGRKCVLFSMFIKPNLLPSKSQFFGGNIFISLKMRYKLFQIQKFYSAYRQWNSTSSITETIPPVTLIFKESILGSRGHQEWWFWQGFVQRRMLSLVRDRLLGHHEENDLWNNESEVHKDKLNSTCSHQHRFILKETKQWVMWGMQGTADNSFTISKSFRVFAYDHARQ